MQIQYLGTSAAEGIPALFCHCSICDNARKVKGKEIRTRMQAVIDNTILIDFGPDTFLHILRYDLDISLIEICLITHSHADHFFPNDILMRKGNHALYNKDIPSLLVYGGLGVKEKFDLKENDFITKDGRVIFKYAKSYESFVFKNYKITPLPAIHKTKEPLIYLIQKSKKSILYAHDTDIFSDDVWEFLQRLNIILDVVSLDCTEGIKKIDYKGHMNFERDFYIRDKMFKLHIADQSTKFVASHFSHNGLIDYKSAVSPSINKGFIIAYDGMVVDW